MELECFTVLQLIERIMKKKLLLLLKLSIIMLTGVHDASSQELLDLPETDDIPSSLMTFFVTNRPIGNGGNLGGLTGADTHCQALATEVGQGHKVWRAYLSTQARPGEPAINARDRIGDGPWAHSKARISDYRGRRLSRPLIKSQIHGDTLIEAQRGSNMSKEFALTEKGQVVNGIGDPLPTLHAILTGSNTGGRAFDNSVDRTCNNWTSSGSGYAQVGHSDRVGNGNTSWNSANTTTGCSQDDLISHGGSGLFYCFAIED